MAGRRVLLGVTGGIAAYKAAILARALVAAEAEVTCVLTESATRFVGAATFAALTGREAFTSLWERPGEVLHVRLAHDADLVVIAPCTANVVAKLAHGAADDLLSATLLEYDGPVVLAPAMHTGMWNAEATRANVATLEARGVRVVGPTDGPLAHGDAGVGRMSEPDDIVRAVLGSFRPRDLDGRRILITAGPTHEPIDPVRFVGNRSSGRMGVALAAEAAERGAAVTLVLGPGHGRAAAPCRRRADRDGGAAARRRPRARGDGRRRGDGRSRRGLPAEDRRGHEAEEGPGGAGHRPGADAGCARRAG